MNLFKGILAFTAGVAVGVFASWKIHEKRCDKIIEEEVASVKEAFKQKPNKENTKEESIVEDVEDESEDDEYEQIVNDLGYSGTTTKRQTAYVISPDQFGEIEDYEKVSLTLYADNSLAWDSDDTLMLFPETMLGEGSLDRFGEYEDGVLHVRNELLKTDFEISQDLRRYSEVCEPGEPPEEDGE